MCMEVQMPATEEGATGAHMPGILATEETEVHVYCVDAYTYLCAFTSECQARSAGEQAKRLES